MKKLLQFVCILLTLAVLFSSNAMAAVNTEKTEEIIYFADGSYITIEIIVTEARAASTKSGSKVYVYKGSDGVEEWRAVLTGSFTYTGTTAACTASNCIVTITDTDWYVVSKTTSKSGASALGTVVMGRKWLGVTVDKETFNMQLTCDANGNLS